MMEHGTAPPDEAAFKGLRYLTVQDVLWINLQATNKVHHFNYAKLEEATFYQYGYGASRDLARQAGRFVSGFLKLHPFEAGNEPTAFIAVATFLLMNGARLNIPDSEGSAWIERIRGGAVLPQEQLPSLIVEDEEAHNHIASDVRDAVRLVIEQFPKTIAALVSFEQRAAS